MHRWTSYRLLHHAITAMFCKIEMLTSYSFMSIIIEKCCCLSQWWSSSISLYIFRMGGPGENWPIHADVAWMLLCTPWALQTQENLRACTTSPLTEVSQYGPACPWGYFMTSEPNWFDQSSFSSLQRLHWPTLWFGKENTILIKMKQIKWRSGC